MADLADVRRLVDGAFADFTDDDWDHALGGWHAVAVGEDGSVLAHASVVGRDLDAAGQRFRTGYVEAVATSPPLQRRGLGSAVLAELAVVLRREFELGALSTSSPGFYERFGWERWQGPTYVRHGDGALVRTEDEDDGVMVLPFGPSATIDLAAPISCEARSGDDW